MQKKPNIFPLMRSITDSRKRNGEGAAHFILLGSTSRNLLQQSSETLAGRIRYLELTPLSIKEIYNLENINFSPNLLWFRGGFPDSYNAPDNDESWQWRINFISSYIERDIPMMGVKISASLMTKLISMLAHYHGQQVNYTSLSKSLETSHTTIKSYIDTLTEFYIIRQLKPWSGNSKKRLVKSPKIYFRDSGLLHSTLKISDFDTLQGHPVVGTSWEGFIIENIIKELSSKWNYCYYRTATQNEIDLILETPKGKTWAIEIKRSLAPKVSKNFHNACDEVGANKKFVVYSGTERYPMSNNLEAIGIIDFLKEIELQG